MLQTRIRITALLLSDLLTVSAVWILVASVYHALGGSFEMSLYYDTWPMLGAFVLAGALFHLYHGNLFHTEIALNQVQEIKSVFQMVILTYLLFFAHLAMNRQAELYSRFVILCSFALTMLLLIPMRNLTRMILKACHIGQIPFLLAGHGHCGKSLLDYLEKDIHFGLNPIGFVDDDAAQSERLGGLKDAVAVAKQYNTYILICCVPPEVIQHNLYHYTRYFSSIVYLTDGGGYPILWGEPANIHRLAGTQFRNQLLNFFPRVSKSMLEFCTAIIICILILPVMAVLAVLVKLSGPGPIIYASHRLGRDGVPITIHKFRTMKADSDKMLEKILSENPVLKAEWEANFKLNDDPRVTKIGRFLRKTSLDELPQFFDVLTGRIAIIGPRPIVESEVEKYGENYEIFARVKPGITGLWQVSGRSDTDYAQRVALDLWYIQNWSVWMDLHIFFATFGEVIRCRGAK